MSTEIENASSAVRFFLAKALAPHLQANARWVAVNALTKQTFTLSGKDRANLLLGELASGGLRAAECTASMKCAIAELGARERLSDSTYLSWYRALNFDYPFLDYSEVSGRSVDRKLMRSYAISDSPPSYDPFACTQPVFAASDEPHIRLHIDRDRSVENLAATWIRAALGIKARRVGEQGPLAHKTSPSGGARHPTEAVLAIRQPAASAHDWIYNPEENRFLDARRIPHWVGRSDGPVVAITLFSNIDRVSWRYRDPRALRPALIDAGHIVETIKELVAHAGWATTWQPLLQLRWDAAAMAVPILGVILATPTPSRVAGYFQQGTDRQQEQDAYCTNPLISLAVHDTGITAHNHLHRTELSLKPGHVDALAYGVPSTRGDRRGTPAEIVEFSGISMVQLGQLIDSRLLIPETLSLQLWKKSKIWSDRSWYLSLLTLADKASNQFKFKTYTASAQAPIDLGARLERRCTRRSFQRSSLPHHHANKLWSLLQDTACDSYVVVMTGSDSVEVGIYSVTKKGRTKISDEIVSDEFIVKCAIGQPWAAGFAYVIYLMPPIRDPWHNGLIELGAVGQRIALLFATDPSIGVFQSPAVVDELWERNFGLGQSMDGCYMVGIGLIKDDSDLLPWSPVFSIN
ncbi:MAG: hypothetical protein ACRDQ4_23415 [Pseudonocardiaceae bacterium]